VDGNSIAPGAVTSSALADGAVGSRQLASGAVDATALGAVSVNTGNIVDLAVTAPKLGAGSVTGPALAAGAVTSAKIAAATIAGANIAGATITGSNIATGTITGSNINTATTITATDFVYTTPVTGSYFANPLECQRGLSGAVPHQDLLVFHPPANALGPGIGISNLAAANYEMFCPVNLQPPPGATLTVTGADLGFLDNSTNCLIGAQLRTKTLGAVSNGAILATQFDGANGADFAFMGGPALKAFPVFTAFTVTTSTLFWVNASIQLAAAATTPEVNCRYQGVRITYTLDRP
jgi:hypothetical protein